MTIKDDITLAMQRLARKKNSVFLGENIINSGRLYGTLSKVPLSKCIEMPVAENLIAGTAIGLAIAGYHPICIFQRMDFMLIAADQIINHACLIPQMSGGSVVLPIIFRCVKANLNKEFWVGHQHSKDFTHVFDRYIKTIAIPDEMGVEETYEYAWKANKPILIVEEYKHYMKEQ